MRINLILGVVFVVPGLYFMLVDKAYDFLGLVLVILGVIELGLAMTRKIEKGVRR